MHLRVDALQHEHINRRGAPPVAAEGTGASDMSGLPSLAPALAVAFLLRFAGLPSSPSAFLLHTNGHVRTFLGLRLST